MSEDLSKAILWLNAQSTEDPITLYIDSTGGSVTPGLAMYDMIRHSKAPVNAVVIEASSMAAVILQACKKRSALPHSTVLVHSISLAENTRLCDVEDNIDKALARSRKNQLMIDEIYHKRAGISLSMLRKMNRRDKSLNAKEALELNLIDEILDKE